MTPPRGAGDVGPARGTLIAVKPDRSLKKQVTRAVCGASVSPRACSAIRVATAGEVYCDRARCSFRRERSSVVCR